MAESTNGVKALARRKGPGLIFATIQKYRDPDSADDAPLTEDDLPKVEEPKATYKADEKFEVLNESDSILVLVDEAHRTQAGDLHANLLAGLPNCARIGFTGTPIIIGKDKRTHEILASSLTATPSRKPRPTVRPCLCSTRAARPTAPSRTAPASTNCSMTCSTSTCRRIWRRSRKSTPPRATSSMPQALIADKARDILRHYVTNILPNGYKAQVVAYSRLAAIRYFEALRAARDELLAEAHALSPETGRWMTRRCVSVL